MNSSSIHTSRFRWFLIVALDLATGARSRAGRSMQRALAGGDVQAAELAEIILHLSLLCGVPTALDGLERLRHAVGRWPARRDRPSLARGRRAFVAIYGQQAAAVLSRLRKLDPFLQRWILRDVYGTIFSRQGVDLRERTLLTGIILAVQGLQTQSASHVRGTLRLGVEPAEALLWIGRAERRIGRRLPDARRHVKRFAR